MKKIINTLLIGALPFLISSCATVMRDNTQAVTINSNVEDVNIKITNKSGITVWDSQTPVSVVLKTSSTGYFDKERYTVIASKQGYKTKTLYIKGRPSKWYMFGNLIFGGLIGYFIVDPLTGDMYYLNDKEPFINMTPINKG